MKRLLAALAAAGCIAVAGCGSHGAGNTAGAPAVHLHFPAVGVYEADAPQSYSGVAALAAATGAPIGIAGYFSNWGSPFDTSFAVQAAHHGAVPLVVWEPYVSLTRVAKGIEDKYLRSYAAQVKKFGDPVIIAFGHEMNACTYPWGSCKTTPKKFVEAWRHIVRVFRKQGVKNVKWLWEVKVGHSKALRADYPGNKWVDYVGVTGYYTKVSSNFKNVLLPTIDLVRRFAHRPMIVAETGISPDKNRPAQITNLFRGLRFNAISAVVYFDVDQKKHPSLFRQDWRLDGDRSSLLAFFRGAKNFGAG